MMGPSHQLLRRKWVYKVKYNVNGYISWFKARLVIKRYLQQYDVDFYQIYALIHILTPTIVYLYL